jgi:WD40 repeat protein
MSEALRAIEVRQIIEMPGTEIVPRSPAGSLPLTPYPGLRPFEQDEWPIFLGRERITRDIVDRLTATQIVVIHGSSGCGKSSFVRAGVLAQLDRECAREGWQWQTAVMHPGSSPLWNLAEAVARIKHGGSAEPSIEQIRTVRQQLNIGRGAFTRIAQDLRLGSERQVCILLDQFEELFRFVEEIGPDEAEMFAAIICGFTDAPPDGIHLVITVRSDHLGDFSQFHGLAEVVNGNQYLLPRLSDDDLIRAITQPAILYKGEVKLNVAMKLLRDSDGEVDALPLIQHCLMRMWQEVESGQKIIELHHYHGLREGLSAHADEIVAGIMADPTLLDCKSALECVIKTLFCALTAVDANGRHIRRQQTFGQLVDLTRLDPVSLDTLLRPFRAKAAGFLKPQGTRDLGMDDIVDISHEALIRHWTKLAGSASQPGWIQTEGEDGQRYRTLLEIVPGPIPHRAAKKWIDWWQRRSRTPAWASRYGGNFEQVELLLSKTKMRRAWRRAAIIVTSVLLIALPITGVYWRVIGARDQAEEQFESAQNARAIALASLGEQVLLRDGPTRGLLVAIEGLKSSGDTSVAQATETLPIIPQTQRLAYQALRGLREKYIVPGKRFSAPLVSFSPDSDLLAIARSGGTAQLLDTKTGAIVAEADIGRVRLLTAMKWVVDNDTTSLRLFGQDEERKSSVFALDACSDELGNTRFDCGKGTSRAGAMVSKLFDSVDTLRTVSPDGQFALSGGWSGADTRLWSVREKRLVNADLPQSFNSTFNSDHSSFALVLQDRIQVFDMKTFLPQDLTADELARPGWKLTAFAFGPKNTVTEGKLFTATVGTARLWDLRTGENQLLPKPASGTFQAVFSPTGDSVAATLDNGAVQVWRFLPEDRIVTFLLKGHAGNAFSIDFSRDGRLIATGSMDGTARVWQLRGALAPEVNLVSHPSNEPLQDRISGKRVLENRDGVLSVRNQADQEPFVLLNGTPQEWQAYGFVPGGVAAITQDGRRRYFWTVFSSAAELLTFAQDHLPVCDGKRLALTPRRRASLLGLPDPSPSSADQNSVCGYPLAEAEFTDE